MRMSTVAVAATPAAIPVSDAPLELGLSPAYSIKWGCLVYCAERLASSYLHLPVNCSSSLRSHGDKHTHSQQVNPLRGREKVLKAPKILFD